MAEVSSLLKRVIFKYVIMETKKNKNADVSRKSIFHFQIGLILVLLLVWLVLEWKAYNQEVATPDLKGLYEFSEPDVPVTMVKESEPLKIPQEVEQEPEVIDDDMDVPETLIASTENWDNEPVDVEDVVVVDKEEPVEDFLLLAVEEVPVFPGCEGLASNDERISCMNGKIQKVIGRKFDTSVGAELGLSGVHRIFVNFKIQADGTVQVLGARGPHPILEKEAIRVVKALPDMQPGKQQGKPVGVLYSLPITFRVQD